LGTNHRRALAYHMARLFVQPRDWIRLARSAGRGRVVPRPRHLAETCSAGAREPDPFPNIPDAGPKWIPQLAKMQILQQ